MHVLHQMFVCAVSTMYIYVILLLCLFYVGSCRFSWYTLVQTPKTTTKTLGSTFLTVPTKQPQEPGFLEASNIMPLSPSYMPITMCITGMCTDLLWQTCFPLAMCYSHFLKLWCNANIMLSKQGFS